MKLEDLVSGLSDKSDDELLAILNDIRRERTTRTMKTPKKRATKSAEDKALIALRDLSPDDLKKLLSLLGEPNSGETP